MANLSDVLFKDYRKRILSLLLMNPDDSYHVREVARLTDTIAATTGRELKTLADAGILTSERRGNQLGYRANRHCPIFDELASIVRKTSGLAEVLREALVPLTPNIDAAFVFGSAANGKAGPFSDVDVCIVGDIGFAEVVHALYDTQTLLKREITPKCFSRSEWLAQHNNPSAFIEELQNKEVINVIGNRDGIGQLGNA